MNEHVGSLDFMTDTDNRTTSQAKTCKPPKIEWSQCYIEPGYLDETETPLGYSFYLRIFARLLAEAEAKTIAKEFIRLIGLQEHQTVYSAAHRMNFTELRFFINRIHPQTGCFADIGDPRLIAKRIEFWLKDTGYAGGCFVKSLPFEHGDTSLAYFEAGCAWASGEIPS